jgi:catechol 2,3-dioxygenase-like lactoylglutathione lyase family enzyme
LDVHPRPAHDDPAQGATLEEEQKMTIGEVAVVSVPVSDPCRAKAFYVHTLGLELTREDDSAPGFHWIQVAPRGSLTALTLVTWFETMPAGSLRGLVLRCRDLQADYEGLVAKGVEFDGPPHRTRYAIAEAVLRDPDGNQIVLQQA